MSDEIKVNLAKAGALIGALAGIAGLLGAWFILPYRMAAAESEILALRNEARATRELLIRIDTNVTAMIEERARQRAGAH